MGMPHCRAEFLDAEIRRVFTAIDRHPPSPTDRAAAVATIADHWGELTGVHPFRDGNSRSQRLFFDRYLRQSGWALDWTQIDASAVHAARHVAMATVDSSYLAATLRPGIHRLGEVPTGTLIATQDTRDVSRSVEIFRAMIDHKRAIRWRAGALDRQAHRAGQGATGEADQVAHIRQTQQGHRPVFRADRL